MPKTSHGLRRRGTAVTMQSATVRVGSSVFNPPCQKAQKTPQAFLFPSNTKKMQSEFMTRRLGTTSKGATMRFKSNAEVEMPSMNPLQRMTTHVDRKRADQMKGLKPKHYGKRSDYEIGGPVTHSSFGPKN